MYKFAIHARDGKPSLENLIVSNPDTKREICNQANYKTCSNPSAKKLCEIAVKVFNFFVKEFENKSGYIPLIIIELSVTAEGLSSCKSNGCHLQFKGNKIDPAVIAHMWTHGLIDSSLKAPRTKESTSLRVSLADIMGILFRESIYPTRSWSILGRDISKYVKMNEYKTEDNEDCVLHNSLIASHAFYVALGDSDSNWDMVKIWYSAMLDIAHNETFVSFAKMTIQEYSDSYPLLQKAIKTGWLAVGITE